MHVLQAQIISAVLIHNKRPVFRSDAPAAYAVCAFSRAFAAPLRCSWQTAFYDASLDHPVNTRGPCVMGEPGAGDVESCCSARGPGAQPPICLRNPSKLRFPAI